MPRRRKAVARAPGIRRSERVARANAIRDQNAANDQRNAGDGNGQGARADGGDDSSSDCSSDDNSGSDESDSSGSAGALENAVVEDHGANSSISEDDDGGDGADDGGEDVDLAVAFDLDDAFPPPPHVRPPPLDAYDADADAVVAVAQLALEVVSENSMTAKVVDAETTKVVPCLFCHRRFARPSAALSHMSTCTSRSANTDVNFWLTQQLFQRVKFPKIHQLTECQHCHRACVSTRALRHIQKCAIRQRGLDADDAAGGAGGGARAARAARPVAGPVAAAAARRGDADPSMFGLERLYFAPGNEQLRATLLRVRRLCAPLCSTARPSTVKQWRYLINAVLTELTAIGRKRLRLCPQLMGEAAMEDLSRMGTFVLSTLPGLVQLLQRRGDKGKLLIKQFRKLHNDPRVQQIGVARLFCATILQTALTNNVLPDWKPSARTEPSLPSQKTIRTMAEQGFLSKSVQLARSRGAGVLPNPAPDLEHVREFAEAKFPAPLDSEEALPDVEDMPHMDEDGNIEWSDVDEVRQSQQAMFGARSAVVSVETLEKALRSLSWESSPGISCVSARMLRILFEDSTTLETVLLPFVRMVTAGNLSSSVMRTWLTGRLCLLPKKDTWRPLGIGCALLRLINKAMMLTVVDEAKEYLQDMQLAVGVSDAGVIVPAMMQAMFDRGICILNTDSANAYNTMSRSRVLRELRQHCPRLVRWFLTCYHQPTPMWRGDGESVTDCKTGVLQGDPLSTLFYCIAFHACLRRAAALVKDREPRGYAHADEARPLAYADDSFFGGHGVSLMNSVPDLQRCFLETGSTTLAPHKSQLLVGHGIGGDELADIRAAAAEVDVPVRCDGIIVMGVPVGTDAYIQSQLQLRLGKYGADLEVLEPFTAQQQFAVISKCINARPKYLQRYFEHGATKEVFEKFDRAVTDAIIGVANTTDDVLPRSVDAAHLIRGLPLCLAGLGVPRMADHVEHHYALNIANHRIASFVQEQHPDLLAAVTESRWRGFAKHLHVQARDDFEPGDAAKATTTAALGGHTLGNIPPAQMKSRRQCLAPDIRTPLHSVAEKLTDQRLHGRLATHTNALNIVRGSLHNNQLAAQMLSASVTGSGRVYNWFPVPGQTIKDESFTHLLKMRLCIADWNTVDAGQCRCATLRLADVPLEEVGNAALHRGATVMQQPLHGLCCRKIHCAGRIVRRHNEVRDVLWHTLQSVEGMTCKTEQPMKPGSEHKADLMVKYGGKKWLVDVVVTCPATAAQVTRGAHLQPGVAADKAYRRKIAKYAPILGNVVHRDDGPNDIPGFQPFAVETGGRIHQRSVEWLDTLLATMPSVRKRCFDKVACTLGRHHGAMLYKFKQSLH